MVDCNEIDEPIRDWLMEIAPLGGKSLWDLHIDDIAEEYSERSTWWDGGKYCLESAIALRDEICL